MPRPTTSETGSLRIGPLPKSRSSDGQEEAIDNGAAAPPPAPAEPEKPYLARLVMLVPAEVISLYVALKPAAEKFLPAFGVICLLLVILVRWKATAGPDGKPEWGGILISTLSFALWIYSVGGSLPWPPPQDSGVISVAIGIWTFAVPYFYKGAK